MEQQAKIESSGSSPSFSFYSSGSSTSMAAAKVIREENAARFHEFGDFNEDDFEFSLELSDDEVSANEIDSRGWTVFPVFNRDLLVEDEVKMKDHQNHASDSITAPVRNLFIDDGEDSTSCSSSEAHELETLPSGTFCVWRPKADGGSSPVTKIKKSSSTGSGSKRWSFRYLLRRSNSEGKEPVALLNPNKVDSPKQKRNSGEVSKVVGRLKAQTPIHEQFYVQRRAEKEVDKRKLYLPYRQVGLFTNVNGMGKMLSSRVIIRNIA